MPASRPAPRSSNARPERSTQLVTSRCETTAPARPSSSDWLHRRTRRGLRRPVGYDVLPGQLANTRVVEVGKRLVRVDHSQSSPEVETEILRREHRFGGGSIRLCLLTRGYRTGLARQFLVRHLPCIGNTFLSLERQKPAGSGLSPRRRSLLHAAAIRRRSTRRPGWWCRRGCGPRRRRAAIGA